MADEGFPKLVENIVATFSDIYRHQGDGEIVEVLESASARFEFVKSTPRAAFQMRIGPRWLYPTTR